MAVAVERHGQLHYLDPGTRAYAVGDWVRYPTDDGVEVAQVVWAPEEVDAFDGELPVCAGPATPADRSRDEENRQVRADAQRIAKDVIAKHGLPMKVVGVDFLDQSRDYDRLVAIYYTAPHRVDFRQLLGDLARALDARIDLRQIGARDAARIVGGVGQCGRELCCTSFLKDFEPVSMRLARVQGLPANPLQISGACGRLMCCLKYEHPLYIDFLQQAPSIGEHITTTDGETGQVIGHDVPSNAVTLRHPNGEIIRCPLESVCSVRRDRVARKAVHE
ncbi:MAG: regulatory iron-sulfur-containing complex subunit RicT [Propionibacteriaceae bacterium]|nr:regulatory iron-sulfur-containing complex subunit RicT [Propionibacteriaceae bacterium]